MSRWVVVSSILALFGCSKSKAHETAASVSTPKSTQLKLALYSRKNGLGLRVHLRFSDGENSYNYIRADGVWVGLFRVASQAAQAKAFTLEECKKLSKVLAPASLAEAELRTDDTAAFMQRLLKHETITSSFQRASSIAKIEIACTDQSGAAWRGEEEFDAPASLESRYGHLITELARIGDEAVAAASTK
jgi:hypothetical protein